MYPTNLLKTKKLHAEEFTSDKITSTLRLAFLFSRGQSITSEENADVDDIPWNAIKDGDLKTVLEYLENYSVEILLSEISISLATFDVNKRSNARNHPSRKVLLTLTPFHMAVMAKQTSIVNLFMEKLVQHAMNESGLDKLKMVLGKVVLLTFPKNPKYYSKDDVSVDGMNVFHLTAKYCIPALKIIFRFLNAHGLIDKQGIKELLQEQDKHLQQTPLHIAAKCSSLEAIRLVLYIRNFTLSQ
jgi:ankyrin repeat protein